MIFDHPTILSTPEMTHLAVINSTRPILHYRDHYASLLMRIADLIESYGYEESLQLTKSYLELEVFDADDALSLADVILQSTPIDALLTDLQENWDQVTLSDMEMYYADTQLAVNEESSILPSDSQLSKDRQQSAAEAYRTQTFHSFIENLTQYHIPSDGEDKQSIDEGRQSKLFSSYFSLVDSGEANIEEATEYSNNFGPYEVEAFKEQARAYLDNGDLDNAEQLIDDFSNELEKFKDYLSETDDFDLEIQPENKNQSEYEKIMSMKPITIYQDIYKKMKKLYPEIWTDYLSGPNLVHKDSRFGEYEYGILQLGGSINKGKAKHLLMTRTSIDLGKERTYRLTMTVDDKLGVIIPYSYSIKIDGEFLEERKRTQKPFNKPEERSDGGTIFINNEVKRIFIEDHVRVTDIIDDDNIYDTEMETEDVSEVKNIAPQSYYSRYFGYVSEAESKLESATEYSSDFGPREVSSFKSEVRGLLDNGDIELAEQVMDEFSNEMEKFSDFLDEN